MLLITLSERMGRANHRATGLCLSAIMQLHLLSRSISATVRNNVAMWSQYHVLLLLLLPLSQLHLLICVSFLYYTVLQVKGKEERIWPFAVVPSRSLTPTGASKDKRSSSRSSASNAHNSSSGSGGGAGNNSGTGSSSNSKAKGPLPGMIGRKKLCEQVLHCVMLIQCSSNADL
jgi:uncharacterized membrane protein YgcG